MSLHPATLLLQPALLA